MFINRARLYRRAQWGVASVEWKKRQEYDIKEDLQKMDLKTQWEIPKNYRVENGVNKKVKENIQLFIGILREYHDRQ